MVSRFSVGECYWKGRSERVKIKKTSPADASKKLGLKKVWRNDKAFGSEPRGLEFESCHATDLVPLGKFFPPSKENTDGTVSSKPREILFNRATSKATQRPTTSQDLEGTKLYFDQHSKPEDSSTRFL
ncbi:hypothetical protein Bbelb_235960 [Branchiostoma belcheri]|nr:hypothetical protein Bbelb_235960 [Branchiostoma belcheri]